VVIDELMTNMLRQLISSVFLLCSAMSAQAHPHVWVTTETTILYENGTFVGLSHKWVFDELYSASAVEGLNKNKDGRYDQEELAELAKADVEACMSRPISRLLRWRVSASSSKQHGTIG
jgi:ABC-type uncharacterized transport system substrate-binding protein